MQYIVWVVIISSLLIVINFVVAKYINKKGNSGKEGIIVEELHPNMETNSRFNIVAEPTILKEEEVVMPAEDVRKHKDTLQTIEHFKRIQQAVNVDKEKLARYVPESFILFKPKDLSGADFYWFKNVILTKGLVDEYGDIILEEYTCLMFATVDCKGQDITGIFPDIIDNLILNQSGYKPDVNSTSKFLDTLHAQLKNALNEKLEIPFSGEMDISLCAIDFNSMKFNYMGAENPVYILRGAEIIEVKRKSGELSAFTNNQFLPVIDQTLDLQKQDCVYLLTDGFINQFGGKEGKRIMFKGLKESLLSLQGSTMEEQKVLLHKTFEFWKGTLEQDDNVLIIGLRV